MSLKNIIIGGCIICLSLFVVNKTMPEETYTEYKIEKDEEDKNFKKFKEDKANNRNKALEKENITEKQQEKEEPAQKQQETSRSGIDRGTFTVTCYDLSVQSCGKPVGHKDYGVTASGFNLSGHTWETARAIAADPKIIPLGSEVELTFVDERYGKYNGTYRVLDVGGAIKGSKIDFFMGDFKQNKTHDSVWEFGKTKARVKVLCSK